MTYVTHTVRTHVWKIILVMFLTTSAMASPLENEVILQADNGYKYILPAYKMVGSSKRALTTDEFYVKSESGALIEITSPELKAHLYAVSLMASNLVQENYLRVRMRAEDGFVSLHKEVGVVRSEIIKPAESTANVLVQGLIGCATFGAKTGTIGFAVGFVPGAVIGAKAGCVIGGGIGAVSALSDDFFAALIRASDTHSGNSRENIALRESEKLLDQMYEISAFVRNESIRWINNKEPFTLQQIQEIADLELTIVLLNGAMWTLLDLSYPTSGVIQNQKLALVSPLAGITANAGLNLVSIPLPVSSLTELMRIAIKRSKSERSPLETKQEFDVLLEQSLFGNSDIRDYLQENSPLSPQNININISYFQSLVPIEYSGSFLVSPYLINTGENAIVRTILQQGGSFYSSGQVSYQLRNSNNTVVASGNAQQVGSEYRISIQAPSAHGKYVFQITAKDAQQRVLGQRNVQFEVNNPLTGRDLAINTLSQSRDTAIQGQHTVTFGLGVQNRGTVTEQIRARLNVKGPNGFSWNSTEVIIGTIQPNEVKNFSNALSWPVPSNLIDGGYTVSVHVSNGVGDISPADNVAERFVYVGNYNAVTPQSLIGKEFQATWKQNIELSGQCGPQTGWGAYGWVNYSRGGNTYAVAVSGAISGSGVNQNICVVVRQNSSTGSLIYSSGGLNDRVGRPIYIQGTPLILFAYPTFNNDIFEFVAAESYSGIGFDVRERTSIPGLKTEFNSKVGSISCSAGHTYIHQANYSSNGRWDFNIGWLVPGNINHQLGTCNSNGRQVFISSSSVARHGFVIEHRSNTQPSGYSPTISGASKVSSHTFYWLTGILDVRDYLDMAVTNANSTTQFIAGRSHNLQYQVTKKGTLNASNMELRMQITGPNGYAFDTTLSATVGINSIPWDTLDLASGQYNIRISLLAAGDANTVDNVVEHAINLTSATPVQIVGFDASFPMSGKAGESRYLSGSLRNFSNQCSNTGSIFAEQLDSALSVLNSTPLMVLEQGCGYAGSIRLLPGVSTIRLTGSLDRHSVSVREFAVSVQPNIRPTAVISSDSTNLENLASGSSVLFTSGYGDPDGDGVTEWVWELRKPDGSSAIYSGVDELDLTLDQAGEYELSHFVIDALGAPSDVDSLLFNVNVETEESPTLALQRAVLIDFYEKTGGQSWANNSGWLDAPGTECSWYGITCDGDGYVTSIRFPVALQNGVLKGNNLTGVLPDELGLFDRLETLSLRSNSIGGQLPAALTELSNLTLLDLANNDIEGEIPSEIGNLANLQTLNFGANKLTGSIPGTIGDLVNLQYLHLYWNELTGPIPDSIGSLSELLVAFLDGNNLTGEIPASIGQLTKLQLLTLNENSLNGTIPDVFQNMPALSELALFSNNLVGDIPASVWQLQSMRHLSLNNNSLSGTLPETVGGLTNLIRLNLNDNQLSGSLPSSLLQLTSLTDLNLQNNQFTGVIPVGLDEMPALTNLNLSGNQFGEEPVDPPPALPQQIVAIQGAPVFFLSSTNTLSFEYTTSDDNATLTGLGIRIHIDSSTIDVAEFKNVLSTSLIGVDTTWAQDTEDFDNNPATDMFATVAWTDISGNWPGSLPIKLFDLELTALASVTTSDQIQIGFSLSSNTPGYDVDLPQLSLTPVDVTLDVDGNGKVEALTDALMIIRNLFGFSGSALIDRAVATDASYTTAEQIQTRLTTMNSILDVDGNGSVDALTDGLLIMRYVFGFRGAVLINNAIGNGAVRNTAEQVESYLSGFVH